MAFATALVTVVAATVAVVLLLLTALLYLPVQWRPVGLYLMVFKVFAVAFTPFIALAGVALAVVGIVLGSWWVGVPAAFAGLGAGVVAVRLDAVRVDLSPVVGAGWEERIPEERQRRMVGRWWRGRLARDPEPRVRRDVLLATLPENGRGLLCDVWQPPDGTPASGVAVVYLHGSAYYILDKDVGTRPMFRHLAAQGHVVVDVAYRLFPETDVPGMVADAKRAVAWVRDNAAELHIDPQRVVLAGGSAGGHLALLAGYSREDPALTPAELTGSDPAVRAVVSLYGQVDLAAMYDHTSQATVCHPGAPPPRLGCRAATVDAAQVRVAGRRRMRLQLMTVAGRCDWLMGGTPGQVPERYAVVSALTHVHRVPAHPARPRHARRDGAGGSGPRALESALHRAAVPVVAVYLPHTDHMFDLVAWSWSPPARTATRVLERFLAGLAASEGSPSRDPRKWDARRGSRVAPAAIDCPTSVPLRGEAVSANRWTTVELA